MKFRPTEERWFLDGRRVIPLTRRGNFLQRCSCGKRKRHRHEVPEIDAGYGNFLSQVYDDLVDKERVLNDWLRETG